MSSTMKTVAITALFTIAVALLLGDNSILLTAWRDYVSPPAYTCDHNGASMEIVSLDPLIMYINDFMTDYEADELLEAAEGHFRTSEVYQSGKEIQSSGRKSQSAGLPASHPVVQCIESRARTFMGPILSPTDDFGTLKLVRYGGEGQKFNLHPDWFPEPQTLDDGRRFNRIASFFAFLDDNCTGGETYFPYVDASEMRDGDGGKDKGSESKNLRYREHEEGGVAFRPIRRNALFWVNLFPDGTGDERTKHAGLPLTNGTKVGMNIWPRKFYD